jgi:hypothetical protein
MEAFDILQKQTDLDFLCLEHAIDNGLLKEEISYFEDGSENGDSIFDTIIKKLTEIFNRIKDGITAIFSKKETENTIKNVNEAMKKDPSLKNKKVTLKDHSKEKALDQKMMKEVDETKSIAQLAVKMENYRKQRNKAIAIGAVVTTTLGVVAYNVIKKKDGQISEMQQQHNKDTQRINALRAKNSKLRNSLKAVKDTLSGKEKELDKSKRELHAYKKAANPVVRAQVSTASAKSTATGKIDEITTGIKTNEEIAKAYVECSKNLTNTVLTESKEMVGAIVSAEKSFGEKVSAVTGSVKNIKNAAGNAGKTTAKNITQAITEKENKLTQLKKYHDKNKRITKDSSKSDKERKEALAKVDWALKQISSLEKEITSLKDKK